jgi:hypothetical protein
MIIVILDGTLGIANRSIARRTNMKRIKNMWNFVDGNCAAVKNPEKFLDDWLVSKRNPCSICAQDKPKCSFFLKLVEMGAIDKKGNLL